MLSASKALLRDSSAHLHKVTFAFACLSTLHGFLQVSPTVLNIIRSERNEINVTQGLWTSIHCYHCSSLFLATPCSNSPLQRQSTSWVWSFHVHGARFHARTFLQNIFVQEKHECVQGSIRDSCDGLSHLPSHFADEQLFLLNWYLVDV